MTADRHSVTSREEPVGDHLVSEVMAIAGRAAKAILDVYAGKFHVRHKSDDSPVTDADTVADAIIVAALRELTPDYPVLSEESACPPFETRAAWRRYWLVDPLDGTHGFVSRSGEFTVNVALVDAHRPILGVVHVPVDGRCYYARRGAGAFRRNAGGDSVPLAVRRPASLPLRVVTSRSRRNPLTGAFLRNLGDVRVERIGSALKSCRVAEGRADIYPGFSRTSEWDTAAAQCILEEAGGRMMDMQRRTLRYNTRPELENPRFLAVGDTGRDWTGALPEQGSAPHGPQSRE